MINTYLIDNQVWEKTGSIDNLKDMREAFVEMGSVASALSAENQALKNAINQHLSKDMVEMIEKYVKVDLQENHYWRNTPKEDRQKLAEYGYQKPVVLLEYLELAYEIFDEGLPVFLLHRDGTETLATKGIDMERHINNGGFLGTTQFAREKEEEIYLELDD